MKKVFVLVVAILLSTPLLAQTASDQDATAATNTLFKALLEENSERMLSSTTDDFSIINFDGQVADRDLLGQALGGGVLLFDAVAPTGTRVRTYNNDAAVVSGSSKFKGNLQGTAFDTEVQFTALCVKQGNGWKVASLQFSGK